MAEFNCKIGKQYYMSYPIFLKEKHDLPITYRIILSPASGIELHHSVVKLHYREVNDQAEITDWMKDILFVLCDKSEITKAFEACETNLGDKRVMIEKLLSTNSNDMDRD